MARVKIQITTPSNNVIKVSPGVSALSSVQLYLNELIDVNTQHGADGYVLTQQADGTFAMEAVATTLADLSDTNIPSPQGGDSLVYDADSQKWVPGGVKSVNGQEGDVVITIPSPPPTPGISGLADTNITNLQDDQIIRYDSASGKWLNEDLEALPSGGTTGQALVKASNTDYDVTWDDIAVDVQFHQRYATEAETLRSGATETVELYYTAQADGDGLSESASSDTPTSGYDIRRKLYYAEKAQADPDTSADWTQFTAIADNTTFNNAKAALLAYLKERTGGTVPISLKMTWEEVSQVSYLLDDYSGAAAAYSLRLLSSTYSGDAINVWNGTSYADIGFDGSGELDTTALAAHCGSNDGFIRYWYDQSGNANDAAQTTTSNMPKIYDGATTSVVTEGSAGNEKPAVSFDGADVFNVNISLTASQSQIMVTTPSSVNSKYITGDGNKHSIISGYSGAKIEMFNAPRFTLATTPSGLGLIEAFFSDTTYAGFFNGTAEGSGTYSNVTTNLVAIGAGTITGFNGYTGKMSEYILYNSDQSSNRTGIEDNINTFYNIY